MSEKVQVLNDGKQPYMNYGSKNLNYILHVHSSVEVTICLEGQIDIYINGKSYTLTKGQCVIINAHIPHSYYSDPKIGNKIQGLAVNTDDFVRNVRNYFEPDFAAIVFNAYENEEILEIAKRLSDVNENEFGYLKVVSCYLGLLAVILSSGQYQLINGSNINPTINYILQYIIKKMTQDITLDDIAKDLSISKFYVSHIFSEEIRVNFKNYLNSLRLSASKRLLVQTDEDIAVIASSCGFESIRTFNRDFVKMFDKTPTQFRKEGKDDLKYLDISSPLHLVENSLKNQVR